MARTTALTANANRIAALQESVALLRHQLEHSSGIAVIEIASCGHAECGQPPPDAYPPDAWVVHLGCHHQVPPQPTPQSIRNAGSNQPTATTADQTAYQELLELAHTVAPMPQTKPTARIFRR